jgi:hypothetical protein
VININSLSRIHHRALHELYLSRHDPQLIVSQETINFLEQNQAVFREDSNTDYERAPHIFDSYFQITDSDGVTRLHVSKPSSTPPYCQSESDSEDGLRDLPKTKIFRLNHVVLPLILNKKNRKTKLIFTRLEREKPTRFISSAFSFTRQFKF